jgi:16S rRNA (cytosine967-C5)-methyltransferase
MNTSARRIAFEVISDVEFGGAYSNLLLPKRLSDSTLDRRDSGFATELVYGTLRMKRLLDYYIAQSSNIELNNIDPKVLLVLEIGSYESLLLKHPAHAVVNETVDLAKMVVGKAAATFVNAILRKVVVTDENIDSIKELGIRFSHPDWIINSYRDSLRSEEEVLRLLAANNVAPTPTLLALPGRATKSELLEAGCEALSDSDGAVTFKGNPGLIPAIRERRAIVQDRGSQIVVEEFYATADQQVLRWLDLCAGPGGKAAYLDSLITDGEFVANEISIERSKLVAQVVKRGRVINYDGRTLPSDVGKFDRILIDAPCTGIGALRRRPEVRWRRTPRDLGNLRQLQEELLDSAVGYLNQGGIIGYATCSSNLMETKLQVKGFLQRHPEFSRRRVARADIDGDLQLWTHRDGTDCMFLALLQKQGDKVNP